MASLRKKRHSVLPNESSVNLLSDGLSPGPQLSNRKEFDIKGLNKLDAIHMSRIKFGEPVSKNLIAPDNAANKFYDKHFIAALDKFK